MLSQRRYPAPHDALQSPVEAVGCPGRYADARCDETTWHSAVFWRLPSTYHITGMVKFLVLICCLDSEARIGSCRWTRPPRGPPPPPRFRVHSGVPITRIKLVPTKVYLRVAEIFGTLSGPLTMRRSNAHALNTARHFHLSDVRL